MTLSHEDLLDLMSRLRPLVLFSAGVGASLHTGCGGDSGYDLGTSTSSGTESSASTSGDTSAGDSACGDSSCGDTSWGDSACGDTGLGDNYGDSACGDTGFGDTSFGDTSFGDTSFGDTSFGDTSFGDTSFGDTSFGDTSFGDTGYGEEQEGLCGCDEGDYFIEVEWTEGPGAGGAPGEDGRHTKVFDQPPREALSKPVACDEYSSPVIVVGGSCFDTQISACAEDGECISIDSDSLTVRVSNGVVVGSAVRERGVSEGLDPDEDRASGHFEFNGAAGELVTGQYRACPIYYDNCAR